MMMCLRTLNAIALVMIPSKLTLRRICGYALLTMGSVDTFNGYYFYVSGAQLRAGEVLTLRAQM